MKNVDWMNILEYVACNMKEKEFKKIAVRNMEKVKNIRNKIKKEHK